MTDNPEPSPAIRQLQNLLSISMNESMTLKAQICLLEAQLLEATARADTLQDRVLTAGRAIGDHVNPGRSLDYMFICSKVQGILKGSTR